MKVKEKRQKMLIKKEGERKKNLKKDKKGTDRKWERKRQKK